MAPGRGWDPVPGPYDVGLEKHFPPHPKLRPKDQPAHPPAGRLLPRGWEEGSMGKAGLGGTIPT